MSDSSKENKLRVLKNEGQEIARIDPDNPEDQLKASRDLLRAVEMHKAAMQDAGVEFTGVKILHTVIITADNGQAMNFLQTDDLKFAQAAAPIVEQQFRKTD